MMLYASSCERPSKSSARVFLPSAVSNSYSFSTRTQGRSRRALVISSFRFACSASSFASSARASCHSSRVPTLCSGISSPSSPTPALLTSRIHLGIGRYWAHELRLPTTRKLIATFPHLHLLSSSRLVRDDQHACARRAAVNQTQRCLRAAGKQPPSGA